MSDVPDWEKMASAAKSEAEETHEHAKITAEFVSGERP